MTSTHLRSTLSRAINSENEGVLGAARTKMVGKAALQAPAVGGLKARPVRGVMQEIGNNGAVLKGREPANKGVLFKGFFALRFFKIYLLHFQLLY